MSVDNKEVEQFVRDILPEIDDQDSPDVTLHVFQYIERHPNVLAEYRELGDKNSANKAIGRAVKKILGRETEQNRISVSPKICSLITFYTRYKPVP